MGTVDSQARPMLHYRTILYPVDVAAPAGAAQPLAFELGRRAERIRLLYVDSILGSASHVQHARHRLEALGAEAPCPVDVVVTHAMTPSTAILEHAAAPDVDLVVMDTHGRRGLARFVLGSTAREVVRGAPCPVVTARPGAEEAVLPMLSGGSVLVALDFSEASAEAVRQASDLADALAARVDVLHVPARVNLDGPAAESPPDPEHTVRAARAYRVRAFARAALDGTRHEGADRLGGVGVETGAPADVIVRTATERASGLVVLGTKGLRGVGRLVEGSIAEAVVAAAPCPVLTVKTPARYAELGVPQHAHLPPPRGPSSSVR